MSHVRAGALLALCLAACDPPRRASPDEGGEVGQACASASDCQSALCVARVCAAALPGGACRPPGTAAITRGAPIAAAEDAPHDPPCAWPVRRVAPGFTGAVQELGAHPVGTPLEFEVPPGTASFTLLAQEVDGSAPDTVELALSGDATLITPNPPGFTDVVAPGGGLFFDWTARSQPDPSSQLAVYAGFLAGSESMTVPNTSRGLDLFRSEGQVSPGTWRFTVTDLAGACGAQGCTPPGTGAGVYDLKVLTRPGPLAATATLDLDLYFVSDDPDRPDLTVDAALADPGTSATAFHLRRLVAELGKLFARAGLCLGEVRLHEVPAWAREEFHDLDIDDEGPCSPMARLFSLAAEEGGIHLFLVDALVTGGGSGGATVVGIDGSIPGPSAVPGTVNSGAAVVLADFGVEAVDGACAGPTRLDACGTDQVAYVAAHEAGHWLGLYHTTESSGTLFDPLADTPRCPCLTCAPPQQRAACARGDASLFSGACRTEACGGAENLMFWLVDPAVSAGALSPEQGEVMRYNPASRP